MCEFKKADLSCDTKQSINDSMLGNAEQEADQFT